MAKGKTNNREGDGRAQNGFVLIVAISLIAVLSFLAGTAVMLVKPEIQGASYYRNERSALYMAEAGVQYVVASIRQDLQSGTLQLTNAVENVSYSAPTDYEFEPVNQLNRMADNSSYIFTVTGRYSNAKAVIEVTIRRPHILPAGAFGDAELRLQPNIELYSYDSAVTTVPTAANSTGEANAGSNGNIIVRPGVVLDGVFLLGENETGFSPSPIADYENQDVGRIEPDPLGVNTGMMTDAFSYYSNPANNDNALAGISDNVLDPAPKETITMPGGHYYLEGIELDPGCTLNLAGTTAEPVIFFLSGGADIKPKSVVLTASGRPTDFMIFSESSEDIKLYPNGNFEGLIYAPNANVDLQPKNQTRGVIFCKDLTVKPGAESFIDTSLLDSFLASYVEVVQWRHITE